MLLASNGFAESDAYFAGHDRVSQEDGRTIPRVLVMNLLDTPEAYDGKEVLVEGILSFKVERNAICAEGRNFKCVWIEIDSIQSDSYEDFARKLTRKAKLEKFNDKRVVVRGVFDRDVGNLVWRGYQGLIRNLVEVAGDEKHISFEGAAKRDKQDSWAISVFELANAPEKYHGKDVLVNGYVMYSSVAWGRELPALCQSDVLTSFRNCVWLITREDVNMDDPDYLGKNFYSKKGNVIRESFGGGRAFVRGVFDSKNKGRMNVYTGAIKNITEIFGESSPVYFDQNLIK